MKSEYVLMISIIGSIATSALMWWWLHGSLREMLSQLCDKPGSSDFWTRYTLLMLLIAPLIMTIIFIPDHIQNITQIARRIILAILFGHFIAFALVGRSLFKAVRREMVDKGFVSPNSPKE